MFNKNNTTQFNKFKTTTFNKNSTTIFTNFVTSEFNKINTEVFTKKKELWQHQGKDL